MALARFVRQAKRPFSVKMTIVAMLGLFSIFVWWTFSSSSPSVTSQRDSFGDFAEPVAANEKTDKVKEHSTHPKESANEVPKEEEVESQSKEKIKRKEAHHSVSTKDHKVGKKDKKEAPSGKKTGEDLKQQEVVAKNITRGEDGENGEDLEEGKEGEDGSEEDKEESVDNDAVTDGETEGDGEVNASDEQETVEKTEDEEIGSRSTGKTKKKYGPLFDLKAHYSWKTCSVRSKYNYIPCIDVESTRGKLQIYRHHERSCPKTPPMCLVALPPNGYNASIHWPESKLKILYSNVEHPKLASFIKSRTWLMLSGKHLTFPQNQSEIKGGVHHYLDAIEEMVPDIEWGKNIRVTLDIGCTDSSFAAALPDKEVLTLSLGLKDDLVDLAQVALERGFATIVSPFGTRRLPFPSGVFDAIHCGGCGIAWHSNGGKLLLEMNRILRPGGYFILSSKHDSIEEEEAMSTLTASICWNILAHRTDEVSEAGVKIYQKPESNDIYELRRKKNPPLCKENENPDATWHVPMKTCLHIIPSAIEQRGTEWPAEWPQRLETYPEWLSNRDSLIADTEHWKNIVNKSYLIGMGINWSEIRNVMDMKAIYGGFAAALAQKEVWVMNVVPVHAPNTLPVIYERGLMGIYHDWCESFGTYPRSYDLLHADHLFSRLKNRSKGLSPDDSKHLVMRLFPIFSGNVRCKQPVGIVVEMDRILKPGGWVIIRDKVEILDPLEVILRSLHWEITMTFAKDKEGIICAHKTAWRP